jgi:hypothetical protein
VNLLPGLVCIALGVLVIGLELARRARRPVLTERAPDCAQSARLDSLRERAHQVGASVVELPVEIDPAAVRVRVTRSCVYVYTRCEGWPFGFGSKDNPEPARLLAVWRWSFWRRALVPADRRQPEWSPAWSRPLAENAWGAR